LSASVYVHFIGVNDGSFILCMAELFTSLVTCLCLDVYAETQCIL